MAATPVLSQSIRASGFRLRIVGGSAAGLAALLLATPAAATRFAD